MIDLQKNKPLLSTQHNRTVISFAVAAVALTFCAIVWHIAPATKEAPNPHKPTLTANDVYAATFRALRADKACIDFSRNTLLVHFPKYKELKKDEKDKWAGWWYMKMPKFHYLPGNDTWFLEDIDNEAFTQIWPSSHNHKCGEAKDFEGK